MSLRGLRFLRRLLYCAVIVWLLACTFLFVVQRKLLYMPQPRHLTAPLLQLQSDAGPVLVSVQDRPGADALIYFGGNAEDVSQILPKLAQSFPDRALYLLHYRGFGGSAGEPTQEALVADALALFDLVRQKHVQVGVIGRSLGSGVAMQLAAVRPVARIALITPFASVTSVAEYSYPWMPVRWLLKDQFDSAAIAQKVTAPCQVLLAGQDQVVPLDSSRQLLRSFARPPVVRIFQNADHNDIATAPDYFPVLKAFFANLPDTVQKGTMR